MGNQVTAGFVSLSFGPTATDGGMGQSLTPLGYIRENTTTLVQEKPTKTQFMAEGVTYPIYTKKKAGALVLAFTIMAPDPAALVALIGGTVTGTAPNRTYDAPLNVPTIEGSMTLVPQDGFSGIDFVKVDLSANINAGFGDDGLFQVEVECTVLQPDKAGVKPFSIRE